MEVAGAVRSLVERNGRLECDLAQIIAGISKMLQRLLGENIVLESRYPSVLPAICADVGMVEQIILNLAVNARDAMPQGGRLTLAASAVTLDASAAFRNAEARAGRFVCLSVADTGCGMDAKTLSKIFEPFFTTKEVGKGTGLGLSMVYGLVKQHRGWIEVASTVRKGSTFQVFFPAHDDAIAEDLAEKEAQRTVAGGHETILVAEDDPALRRLALQVLRRCGYRVFEARTGQEALSLWELHAGEIDLLLTDMVMPEGINGRELAERLRRDKDHLPVIYTSGYSMDAIGPGFCVERRRRVAAQTVSTVNPGAGRPLLSGWAGAFGGKLNEVAPFPGTGAPNSDSARGPSVAETRRIGDRRSAHQVQGPCAWLEGYGSFPCTW